MLGNCPSSSLVVFGNCFPWKEIHRTRKHLSKVVKIGILRKIVGGMWDRES